MAARGAAALMFAAVSVAASSGAPMTERDAAPPSGAGDVGHDPNAVVPEAEFTSYYGRPMVKASPWTLDIPAYLFLGGVAAGSSAFAAGASVTGRPGLRRLTRLSAVGGDLGSTYALIHDLGRPERFYMMLRVAKPTSPMSMGTWLLSAYGPAAGLAAAGEFADVLPAARRHSEKLLAAGPDPLVGSPPPLAPGTGDVHRRPDRRHCDPAWKEAGGTITAAFAAGALASGAGVGLFAPLVRIWSGAAAGHALDGWRGRRRHADGEGGRARGGDVQSRAGREAWHERPKSCLVGGGILAGADPALAHRQRRRRYARCWPARAASGSPYSRRVRRPPATRSTPSSRSANVSRQARADG